MDAYIVTLTVLGFVVLLTAWLPMAFRRLPLSLPIACLAIGTLLALSPFPLAAALQSSGKSGVHRTDDRDCRHRRVDGGGAET